MQNLILDDAGRRLLQSVPAFGDIAERDTEIIAEFLCRCNQFMERSLGPSLRRCCPEIGNESETTRAAIEIAQAARNTRRSYLRKHGEWLYDVLTCGRTQYKSLHDLAYDAASIVPGLVPTLHQMQEEAGKIQAEKWGHEIDQGIFFGALLEFPSIGKHICEAMLRPTPRAVKLLADFRLIGRLEIGSVTVERDGTVAHVTLQNNECLNAETDSLVDDLETAIDLSLMDEQIRVGVLRGGVMEHKRYKGKRVFSSGINLKALRNGKISFINFILRRELGMINKIIRGLHVEAESRPAKSFGKPWVAVVDSFAIGGGMQVILACDYIIAAADSYFSLPAAAEGIIPGVANLRLARLLGNRKSRQIILGGRRLWAKESDAALLVDEVVEPKLLDTALARAVAQLSAPAILPNRYMLNCAEEPQEVFLNYIAEFSTIQAERLYSADVLQKISAFPSQGK